MRTRIVILRAAFLLGLATALLGLSPAGRAAAGKPVSVAREVKPLLARKCFACHGPTANEGGLRLHEREPALAELDSGLHAIVPSNESESALLERVTAEDE